VRACERNGRNLGLKKTRGNYEGREGKRWRKEKIRLETLVLHEGIQKYGIEKLWEIYEKSIWRTMTGESRKKINRRKNSRKKISTNGKGSIEGEVVMDSVPKY